MNEATTARHILLRMIYECRSDHWTTVWLRLAKWIEALSKAEDSYFLDKEIAESDLAKDRDFFVLLLKLGDAGLIHFVPAEKFSVEAKLLVVSVTALGIFMAEAESLPENVSALKPF